MKKSILLSTLFCAALFLGFNMAQAAPPPSPGDHMGGAGGYMRPPAHRPAPPVMHKPPRHHGHYGHHGYRGHHLRRSYIYSNFGYPCSYHRWGIGHPYVSIGFGL